MSSFGYIYKITNKINGKCYIGQTKRIITKRFNEHKRSSKDTKRKEYDYPLYRAFRKYGVENFFIEEIEKCDLNKIDKREDYWINYYDSIHNGYNQQLGGNGGNRIILDENKVIKEYKKLKTLEKVAKVFNCSSVVIEHILQKHNVKIISAIEHTKMECKDVFQYDENHNLINKFASFTEAGKWLIDNNISNAKSDLNAGHCIRRLLLRGNNYIYNYYWETKPGFTQKEINHYKKRTQINSKKNNNRHNYSACPICGKLKSKTSELCQDCSNKQRTQQGIELREEKYGITRETLKQEIRTTSFVQLSEKYGISDNAIRKWCKKYNLIKIFRNKKVFR